MIRWFWRLYLPLVAALLLLPIFGPGIQARFFPVRVGQRIEQVTRSRDRLCWVWVSDKVRPGNSDNVDVFVDTADGDRSVVAIFRADTGAPWRRNGVRPLGHDEMPFCLLMPPHIRPEDRITVRQTVLYHGWMDLWTVPLHLPDIVDPP